MTSWINNRSNYYRYIVPILTAKIHNKKFKKLIEVNCLHIIKEFNRFIGVVDLLDNLIGRYKIRVQSKK